MKKRKKSHAEKVSPGVLARELNVSRQTIWRHRRQGASANEIRRIVAHWKAAQAARAHPGTIGTRESTERGNSHAQTGAADIPAYTLSLAKKEASIAGIRELELQTKRGELADVSAVQGWVSETTAFLRNHTWGLAAALREREHAGAADLVERVLRRTFREWERYSRSRAQHHGLRLPPPLPPPPLREQLTYFERYVRDGMDGTVEIVSNAEQIGTIAWRAAHPSVTTQQAFELIARKNEWDAAMCALLKTRMQWDLLPESDALKERTDADTTLEES